MQIRSSVFRAARGAAVALFGLVLLIGCGDDPNATAPAQAPSFSDGFTFFDLTAENRLTPDLRNQLEKKLGSDAISRRSTLDLQIAPAAFLKEQFPRIHSLNQRLNYSPRERIEHNITRLMYRYPNRKQLPFSMVELIFSNYTRKPLVFHTSASQEEGATVLQTLEDKYGMPKVAQWDDGRQKAHFWSKPGERMIVYALRDRFGGREYQVQHLFMDALEELIRVEEAEREARQREKKEAVRDAF